MIEERFTLEKDYDCEGHYEYCYQDNETGRRFNFADEFCDINFLKLVNEVINELKEENEKLKKENYEYIDAFKDDVKNLDSNEMLDLLKKLHEDNNREDEQLKNNKICEAVNEQFINYYRVRGRDMSLSERLFFENIQYHVVEGVSFNLEERNIIL